MTDVKICEKDGIYTAYQIVLRRGPDGKLQEVAVPIYIPIPNAENLFSLKDWVEELSDSQVNVAVQIFYDKWNFSSGDGRNKLILEALTDERDKRERRKRDEDVQFGLFTTFPTPKKNPKALRHPPNTLGNKMKRRLQAIGKKNKVTVARKTRDIDYEGKNLVDRIRERIREKHNV